MEDVADWDYQELDTHLDMDRWCVNYLWLQAVASNTSYYHYRTTWLSHMAQQLFEQFQFKCSPSLIHLLESSQIRYNIS